jgi:hypothetical protein
MRDSAQRIRRATHSVRHKIADRNMRVCPSHRDGIRTVTEETMANISPGWAVELTGNRIDLDEFRESLKAPISLWIEDYSTEDGVIPILHSVTWKNLSEASQVIQDAMRIIERLNGVALLIHSDAQPVKIGQVMKFDSDGKRKSIIFGITAHFTATGQGASHHQ